MKLSQKHILPACIVAFALILSGCSLKPEATGDLDEIIVFADSLDWLDYKDGLNSFFGQEYLTPVPEREYLLIWKPLQQFERFKRRANIMFIARLNSDDPVSARVKPMLNEEVVQGIESGEFFYIPRENLWARDQYVVYLVAPTRNDMIQRIYDLGELVYDDFEKSYYNRLQERMFKRKEQKELEAYLLEHFPFTLRIQHDYMLLDESREDRYVWLRRLHPNRDRSIAVHWIPYSDTIDVDFDWIVNKRNQLAKKIYQGDVVVEAETHLERVRFKRWGAYRLEGTWKNPRLVIGGPFRTIVFADKKSNMIFMIDFYVQAIGERKKPFLDQLDIMAHTFRAKSYIQQE